jgi:hypothetical protein
MLPDIRGEGALLCWLLCWEGQRAAAGSMLTSSVAWWFTICRLAVPCGAWCVQLLTCRVPAVLLACMEAMR